jgi:tRNA-specific 2-thiouridylase
MSIPAESSPHPQPGARVVVGLSGGVDSSVAALLLLEQGYRVEGLFMKNWDEPGPDGTCRWEADVEDALQVCEKLGIPLNTVDLSTEYRERVFRYFLAEYGAGRTPNPDVLCNQEIKFNVFLEQALAQGAEFIATGHYARIDRHGGRWRLLKARDTAKDQSYFLCRLNQAQLARALFPLGNLTKPEVRALARRAGFVTHDKKDSTGICFIEPRAFREFLARYLPEKPGPIVTVDGAIIGEHRGAHFYTIGQRQGLRIGGVRGAEDAPWYVVAKDVASNTVTVAQGPEHALLYCRRLRAVAPHWVGPAPAAPLACAAKTRYRQPDQACTIEALDGDSVTVAFAEPQRAVAPGQYLVLYDGDVCLGGAVIDQPLR